MMAGRHPEGVSTSMVHLGDLVSGFDEPRVYDLTLARALGFDRARNIRRLIKGNRMELETHGGLVAVKDRSGGTGYLLRDGANPSAGRPALAYYLNEGQSLVICALTRTPAASRVRGELIRVFMLHRARCIADLRPADFLPLVPAERHALRMILDYADVVLAPPAYAMRRRPMDGVVSSSDLPPDGEVIPYLLAPVTDLVIEALALFEADGQEDEPDADREEDGDDEPDADSEPDVDDEDGGDTEPNGDEREESDSGIGDEEGLAEQRARDAECEPPLPGFYRVPVPLSRLIVETRSSGVAIPIGRSGLGLIG